MLPRALALLLLVPGLPAAAAAAGLADCGEASLFALGWSDPDGDGLAWRLECATGTSPRSPDSDGDGLRDDLDPWPLQPARAGDRDCDGVDDRRDLVVRAACERLPARPAVRMDLTVALAVVGPAPDGGEVAALDALAPRFEEDFARATGGLGYARFLPARAVTVAPGVSDLQAASWEATRALLASGDADLAVFVASGLPHAADACACAAWNQRVRTPEGTEGSAGAFDLRAAYGSERLLAIVSLGDASDLAHPSEVRARWLHEVAHAWCCRQAAAGVLAADGAHWATRVVADAADPLGPTPWLEVERGLWSRAPVPDPSQHAYAPLTRLAMGLLAPGDVGATPVLVPRGGPMASGVPGALAYVSAADVLLAKG